MPLNALRSFLTSIALTTEVSEAGYHKMHYLYLIKSIPHPNQRYIGITSDLKTRLKAHNQGRSPHTAKHKPWALVTYLAFSEKSKAVEFEKYLKSHSGKAFANKRLW